MANTRLKREVDKLLAGRRTCKVEAELHGLAAENWMSLLDQAKALGIPSGGLLALSIRQSFTPLSQALAKQIQAERAGAEGVAEGQVSTLQVGAVRDGAQQGRFKAGFGRG